MGYLNKINKGWFENSDDKVWGWKNSLNERHSHSKNEGICRIVWDLYYTH